MSTIRESDLPGIGRKFQLEARSGDKLVIVVHDDGRRELYHFDPDDPDELLSMVTLNDTEARQVAGIIGGLNYTPKALESVSITLEDLVIEWYRIAPINPGPEQPLDEDTTVVVAGERQQVQAFKRLLAYGSQ